MLSSREAASEVKSEEDRNCSADLVEPEFISLTHNTQHCVTDSS